MRQVALLEKHQSWGSGPAASGPKPALLSPHQGAGFPSPGTALPSARKGALSRRHLLGLPSETRESGQGAEGARGRAGPPIPEEEGMPGVGGGEGRLTLNCCCAALTQYR